VSPSRRAMMRPTPSKVRFANGSLPELRGSWTMTMDSGDSTDSLVEEAENYLRRSIDCIMTTRDHGYENCVMRRVVIDSFQKREQKECPSESLSSGTFRG
jgi:hypothetical protein